MTSHKILYQAVQILEALRVQLLDNLANEICENRDDLERMPVDGISDHIERHTNALFHLRRAFAELAGMPLSCDARSNPRLRVKVLWCNKSKFEETINDWLGSHSDATPTSINFVDDGVDCAAIILYQSD